MPELFLDIETVPDMISSDYFTAKQDIQAKKLRRDSKDSHIFWKAERGGLDPFDGKIILITHKTNNGFIRRLKEWENSEYQILENFYDLIVNLQKGYGQDRLQIIGHNILRFDLFFLYQRMLHHKIDEEKRLYQHMINKPQVIDFLQIHLPLNNYNNTGLKHDVLAHAYGFPPKETLGVEEIKHYFEKKYDKIIQYSTREFIYPELFQKIKSDGIISKEKLAESISWYNAKI